MLRLLYFLPCERVLSGSDGVISHIQVLESLVVSGDLAEDLPANAGIPIPWTAVALWHRTESVKGTITRIAKIELTHPDATEPIMHGEIRFEVSNKYLNFRNSVTFAAFPIGHVGIHTLKMYLVGLDGQQESVAEFPISVSRSAPKSD